MLSYELADQLEAQAGPGEGVGDHALCWQQERHVCVCLCMCVCVSVCVDQEAGRVRTRKMRQGEGTAWAGHGLRQQVLSAGTLLRAEWGPKGLCLE